MQRAAGRGTRDRPRATGAGAAARDRPGVRRVRARASRACSPSRSARSRPMTRPRCRTPRPTCSSARCSTSCVEAGAVSPAGREGADVACWAAVHGLSVLLLDGPLRGLPPADREAVLDEAARHHRAGAHGVDGLSPPAAVPGVGWRHGGTGRPSGRQPARRGAGRSDEDGAGAPRAAAAHPAGRRDRRAPQLGHLDHRVVAQPPRPRAREAGDWSDYDKTPVLQVRTRPHAVRREPRLRPRRRGPRATRSFERAARTAAGRPDLAFQEGVPGDFDLAMFTLGPAGALRHRRAVHRGHADRDPRGRRDHRSGRRCSRSRCRRSWCCSRRRRRRPVRRWPRSLAAADHRAGRRRRRRAPRFGVHLCLGDMNNRAFGTMSDVARWSLLANAIVAGWPTDRPLDLHARAVRGGRPARPRRTRRSTRRCAADAARRARGSRPASRTSRSRSTDQLTIRGVIERASAPRGRRSRRRAAWDGVRPEDGSGRARADGRALRLLTQPAARIRATSVWPDVRACSRAVTPSPSAIAGSAPGVEQDPHDLLVRRRPVAQDHRLEQGRPAEVVDVVDVDVGLHDPAYVVDVAAFAGRDDRDAAVAVADRQVGVGGQQGLEHRDAAGHAGHQPRGVVPVVERVRVGPERHEQPGDGHAVVRRREQQRGPVVLVAGLEVRLAAQHQGRRVGVAVGRGGEQSLQRGRAPYVLCSAVFRSRVATAV